MKSPANLESLERLGWRFGLETIRALLSELGDPHLSLKCVHVAGTNGKGTTCAFMASFLRHSGYRVGLYTSPHLTDIRERFRINGLWITPQEFRDYSKRILRACLRVQINLGHVPTHFEALTALAFLWFKEKKVDWVVSEVGLGGRLDATNIIETPAVCLITPVGLEHQEILGGTISKIAWEKAGILKKGTPAATIQYRPEALRRIEKTARLKGVSLWSGGRDFIYQREGDYFRWEGPGFSGKFKLSDAANFQVVNASLALAGIQILRRQGIRILASTLQKALSTMRWPGRLEILKKTPLVLLDGAHNPDGALGLTDFLKEAYPRKRWLVLNGFLGDKNYRSFARALAPLTVLAIVTEPPSDRKEAGNKVFKAWEGEGTRLILIRDWRKALWLALEKLKASRGEIPLLITGSIYLGGACRKIILGYKGLAKI